jgi:hypothetical protein
MFIRNLHGTYERPSITEKLKTIKQKHDESLRDYVKCFYNVRNAIPYIQDIEIINAFCDGVSDIKTVEEIAIRSPEWWPIYLRLLTYALRLLRSGLDFLSAAARGPQRRSRMIRKSTQLTGEIAKIVETADIARIVTSHPEARMVSRNQDPYELPTLKH